MYENKTETNAQDKAGLRQLLFSTQASVFLFLFISKPTLFSFRSQIPSNSHGNRSTDQFAETTLIDQFGRTERRETSGESEGDHETVRETDDADWFVDSMRKIMGEERKEEKRGLRIEL